MRLLGAIFDMDGVLLDSNYIWRDLGSRYLRSQGKEPEADLERFLQPMTMEDTAAYFRTHYQVARTEAEIVRDMTDSIREEYLFHAPAKPGVDKMLSLLKMSGVTMYVATATDRPLAEAALKRTDLMRYFKGIMTCAEAGASKTSPKIYEKCLTRLRCDKQHCVVFEDSLHAIRTAKEAGFRVAAIYDDNSVKVQDEIQSLADYWFWSYDDWFRQGGEIG
jgi:HAD superfamily hydrolase (TIGR01509 family)